MVAEPSARGPVRSARWRRWVVVIIALAALVAAAGCLPSTTIRQFGLLVTTDPSTRTVTFREATLFTGEAATVEAAKTP